MQQQRGLDQGLLNEHILQARLGGRDAFADLVASTEGLLRRRLRRFGLQECDCDDLIEETYLRCWWGLHHLKREESLEAWMYSIARRVYARWYQTHTRHTTRTVHAGLDEIACPQGAPDSAFELLRALPAADAWLLYAKYVEQRTMREIGRTMGWTIDQVAKRLQRARERLRAVLQLREELESTDGPGH